MDDFLVVPPHLTPKEVNEYFAKHGWLTLTPVATPMTHPNKFVSCYWCNAKKVSSENRSTAAELKAGIRKYKYVYACGAVYDDWLTNQDIPVQGWFSGKECEKVANQNSGGGPCGPSRKAGGSGGMDKSFP